MAENVSEMKKCVGGIGDVIIATLNLEMYSLFFQRCVEQSYLASLAPVINE